MSAPSPPLHEAAARLASRARGEGRDLLLEPEGMEVLSAMGVGTPRGAVVNGPHEVPDLDGFPGERVVVKLLSSRVAHLTELGAVRVVERTPAAVVGAVEELARVRPDPGVRFLVQEFVPHDTEPGAEILLGARWSPEFGVVVTLAPGGVAAEAMAFLARPEASSFVWTAREGLPVHFQQELSESILGRVLTGALRGRTPRVPARALARFAAKFTTAAAQVIPHPFAEVEVNPLVFAGGRPVALDALVHLAPGTEVGPTRLPERMSAPRGSVSSRSEALAALLRPATVAVVGASARSVNPGRVILRNLLHGGMDPAAITVVKEGQELLEGCRCVPDVTHLPPVDVLVVSVAAGEVPPVLEATLRGAKAKAVILTSAGLGEGNTEGEASRRVRELLAQAGRAPPQRGELSGDPLASRALRHALHSAGEARFP